MKGDAESFSEINIDICEEIQSQEEIDEQNFKKEELRLKKEAEFYDFCQKIRADSLPGNWVLQILLNNCTCVTWIEYANGCSEITKRIVLFSDMSLKVSFIP